MRGGAARPVGPRWGKRARAAALSVLAALVLAACDMPAPPPGTGAPARPGPASDGGQPSAQSEALRAYFRNVQRSRLTFGLLRSDGGGVDTPFTAAMLMRNFEQIAFRDEYQRSPGSGRGSAQPLRRWQTPVRMRVHFGDSVAEPERTSDTDAIRTYAARLGRITGHSISTTSGERADFHVFVVGEDDRDAAVDRIKALEPGTAPEFTDFLRRMPRDTYCLVLVYDDPSRPHVLRSAYALIRAELPELMRRACIHEELAQGLGALNDSPAARPSIFNDDDEFALLTSHDEAILRMIYDARLRPGMSFSRAQPLIEPLAEQLASPGAGAS